jgi:hypothetical protein
VSEPADLAYLGFHWGGPYRVGYRAGKYRAVRADDGTELSADTAEALLEKIRADYAARPVPRCPR